MPIIQVQNDSLDALSNLIDIWDSEEENSSKTDLNKISDYIADGMVYAYSDEDEPEEIIGVMIVSDDYNSLNLYTLYVHPDYRSDGIGSKLMEKFIDMVDKRSMRAFLEVTEHNPAIDLYERFGFEKDNTIRMPQGHIAMSRPANLSL